MSELIRAFLALDIDNETILKRVTGIQKLMLETGADLKTVKIQNVHVTIRFLGKIRHSMLDSICEEMKKVQFSPFNLKITGIGAFPSINYPRVVWAGITDGRDRIKKIFDQLEPLLCQLGFNSDKKGFKSHITIARVKTGKNKKQLSEFISKNAKYDFGNIEIECLKLKKSDLTPNGPVYSTLRSICYN